MNKKLLKELKENLEKARTAAEEQLKTFAEKDPRVKGDWDSKYPRFDDETGSSALEIASDEVEEYGTRLPVEFSLEIRLRDINLALGKMKKGKYGRCEKCGKKIDEKRLKVCPEARPCLQCQKK